MVNKKILFLTVFLLLGVISIFLLYKFTDKSNQISELTIMEKDGVTYKLAWGAYIVTGDESKDKEASVTKNPVYLISESQNKVITKHFVSGLNGSRSAKVLNASPDYDKVLLEYTPQNSDAHYEYVLDIKTAEVKSISALLPSRATGHGYNIGSSPYFPNYYFFTAENDADLEALFYYNIGTEVTKERIALRENETFFCKEGSIYSDFTEESIQLEICTEDGSNTKGMIVNMKGYN